MFVLKSGGGAKGGGADSFTKGMWFVGYLVSLKVISYVVEKYISKE